MNDHSLPDAPALPELTKDEAHLFSMSYHGLAPVREMWMMFGVLMGVQVLTKLFPLANVLKIVFYVIFLLPLCVRRARQMGAAWYGVVAFVPTTLGTLLLMAMQLMLLLTFQGVMDGESMLAYLDFLGPFMPILVLLILVLMVPLHVYGGALAGRKSELMRAAIAGDEEMARLLVEDDPRALLQKSEKGFTAREYAQRQGHHALAAWLREQEERLTH